MDKNNQVLFERFFFVCADVVSNVCFSLIQSVLNSFWLSNVRLPFQLAFISFSVGEHLVKKPKMSLFNSVLGCPYNESHSQFICDWKFEPQIQKKKLKIWVGYFVCFFHWYHLRRHYFFQVRILTYLKDLNN